MRRMVAVAVLAVVTASCGSSDDGDDGRAGSGGGTPRAGQGGGASGGTSGGDFDAGSATDRNDVSAGEICARVAVIECAGEAACCAAPGRTQAACEQSIQGTCENSLMLDTLAAAPSVAFNAPAARTAFEELEQRAKMCDPAVAAWAVSADGFPSSFGGTLGSGEDCEPEGGLQAPIDDLLIALASCRIGDGLVCLPGEPSWACAPRASAGQRCFNDFNCVEGLFCDNPDGEFDGVCVAGKAAGEECDGPIQCDSLICKDGMCAADGDQQAAYCFD